MRPTRGLYCLLGFQLARQTPTTAMGRKAGACAKDGLLMHAFRLCPPISSLSLGTASVAAQAHARAPKGTGRQSGPKARTAARGRCGCAAATAIAGVLQLQPRPGPQLLGATHAIIAWDGRSQWVCLGAGSALVITPPPSAAAPVPCNVPCRAAGW